MPTKRTRKPISCDLDEASADSAAEMPGLTALEHVVLALRDIDMPHERIAEAFKLTVPQVRRIEARGDGRLRAAALAAGARLATHV